MDALSLPALATTDSAVTCDVTEPRELGPVERLRWQEIRGASPALASPFFAPEFTKIVGEVRRDCRVTVLRRDGDTVGFFPFHAGPRGVARPIGRKLADYQGVVVDPTVEWDAPELIRRSGLRSYSFDHVLASQTQFRPYLDAVERSPILDLTIERSERLGPDEAWLKRRRIERRFGLRFEFHDPDRTSLATFITWKSEQYRRTRAFDILSRPWVVEVLERVHASRTADFAGVFSCLYAGDSLVAAHLALRSGSILHSWFPAFDPSFSRFSPGLVLFLEMIEAAPAEGVTVLDFGKGGEPYKRRFANSWTEVGSGSVESGRASAITARTARRLWSIALRSPLYNRVHRLRRAREVG